MDERSRRIARRFGLPMLLAALLVIPVLIIEQSPHASHSLRVLGVALNSIATGPTTSQCR